MRVIQVALILGILTSVLATEENFEYEDDGGSAPPPVAPPTARGRGSLLAPRLAKPLPLSSNRINKLPTGDKSSAQKSTTTTTTAAPNQEVEENQDYDSEQGPEEVQGEVTTTEASKRGGKHNPRTNRNDDNLKALLKRKRLERLQAMKTSSERPTSTTTISTSVPNHNSQKSGDSRRSRGRTQIGAYKPSAPSQSSQSSNEAAPEAETPKKFSSRKFNSRNSARTTSAPVVEEEEAQPVEEQPRQKFTHRGSSRRF